MCPVIGLLLCDARADEIAASREDQFKAAYLFNFLKFIEWPAAAPTDVLTVCFVGGDGVYGAFTAGLDAKRAGARRLAARRLSASESLAGCNTLYLDAATAGSASRAAGANEAILTVSDAHEFARNGGMIELFTDSNRLRFSINVDNAQKAGLRISSSLLQLAAAVEKEGR